MTFFSNNIMELLSFCVTSKSLSIQASASEWDPSMLRKPPEGKDYEVLWADGRSMFFATREEFAAWKGTQGDWECLNHVVPLSDSDYVPQYFRLPHNIEFMLYNGGKSVKDGYGGVYSNLDSEWEKAKAESLIRHLRLELWASSAKVAHPKTGRMVILHRMPRDVQETYTRRWYSSNHKNHPNEAYRKYENYCEDSWINSLLGDQYTVQANLQYVSAASSESALLPMTSVRDIDLYEVPRQICKFVLASVRHVWGQGNIRNIGFHWSILWPDRIVVGIKDVNGAVVFNRVGEVPDSVFDAIRLLHLDDIKINVQIRRRSKKADKAVGSGEFSVRRNVLHVLEVTLILNSYYTEFKKIERLATAEMVAVIGHELTHARQAVEGTFAGNVSRSEMQSNPVVYYLQPAEVESHVREVVNNSRTWGTRVSSELHTYMAKDSFCLLAPLPATFYKEYVRIQAQVAEIFGDSFLPEEPEDMHVTVAYIPSYAEFKWDVMDVAKRRLRGFKPITMTPRGLGTFPPKNSTKTSRIPVFIDYVDHPQLASICTQINDDMGKMVHADGRRSMHSSYKPHTTLGFVEGVPQEEIDKKLRGFLNTRWTDIVLDSIKISDKSHEAYATIDLGNSNRLANLMDSKSFSTFMPPKSPSLKTSALREAKVNASLSSKSTWHRTITADGQPHEDEEGAETGRKKQRHGDPFPSAFRKEMDGKGKQFVSPKTGNRIKFESLPWSEQLKLYKRWKMSHKGQAHHQAVKSEEQSAQNSSASGNTSESQQHETFSPQDAGEEHKTAFKKVADHIGLDNKGKAELQRHVTKQKKGIVHKAVRRFKAMKSKHGILFAVFNFVRDLGALTLDSIRGWAKSTVAKLRDKTGGSSTSGEQPSAPKAPVTKTAALLLSEERRMADSTPGMALDMGQPISEESAESLAIFEDSSTGVCKPKKRDGDHAQEGVGSRWVRKKTSPIKERNATQHPKLCAD